MKEAIIVVWDRYLTNFGLFIVWYLTNMGKYNKVEIVSAIIS